MLTKSVARLLIASLITAGAMLHPQGLPHALASGGTCNFGQKTNVTWPWAPGAGISATVPIGGTVTVGSKVSNPPANPTITVTYYYQNVNGTVNSTTTHSVLESNGGDSWTPGSSVYVYGIQVNGQWTSNSLLVGSCG